MLLHNNFMKTALIEAEKALKIDEVPVGAVVVLNNKIIARSHNKNHKKNDCTSHAEIDALRKACKKLKTSRLDDCFIYITLEPCLMCATAIALAKIKRVYYALADKKFGAYENGNGIFSNYPSYYKAEIYSSLCENESLRLIQSFFKDKR